MRKAAKALEKPSLVAPPSVPELLEIIEQKEHLIAEQQKLLRLLEEQLRLARQRRFGASSEKLPFQGDFFDEAELEVALSEVEAQLPDEAPSKPKRKPREGFSEKLPRIRIELLLSAEDKAGASQTFFTKVKEELDILDSNFKCNTSDQLRCCDGTTIQSFIFRGTRVDHGRASAGSHCRIDCPAVGPAAVHHHPRVGSP